MFSYIIKRVFQFVPTLVLISVVSFIVIQLPPGDYVSYYTSALIISGDILSDEDIESIRIEYGLDKPLYTQYFKWAIGILGGDFGYSFQYETPVAKVIGSRLGLTFLISFVTLMFTWMVAFPIGIYSATHTYSVGDFSMTFLGFIGLAIPNFLLALVFMWIGFSVFGQSVGGLFSPEFVEARWSIAKFLDLLKHLWIPIIVIGTAGTAALIRTLRANLLDELQKPYVDTARAKGVKENRLLYKYPVRIALIPFISTVGWSLPQLVSGAAITSVVLNLPTTGPMLLTALRVQDMYLAGTLIMFLSFLTVIGTLLSDILLVWLDPRIKYQ